MNLLAMQPDVVIHEFPHVFRMAEELGIESIDLKFEAREYNVIRNQLARLGQTGDLQYQSLSREPTSLYDLFLGHLRIINASRQSKFVGLKITGLCTSYVPQLLSKKVKVIYIYRDPRDVVRSDRNYFAHTDVIERSNVWREYQSAYVGNDNPNLLVVKFEDMICNTDCVLRSLSNFLGININISACAMQVGKEVSFTHNSSFGDLDKLFDEKAVYRWVKNMDEETRFVSYLVSSDLRKYGYDPLQIDQRQTVIFFSRLLKHKILSRLKRAARRLLT